MKKNKLILFVGLTLLIQTEPTHAAASIAELQTSLEVLKTKLVTLAQALGKINQKYTPVDELSPGQKTYFIILKSLAKGGSPQGLAEKMQEYANRADHEGLKTFIGQGYNEDKNAEIFFANLYNGILDSDEIITDPAAKNALSPDQLFPTNDALKTLIEKIIRAIDGKPPWEIGPMTPPRDHGPKGNPNPNPSTATPYADLSADQQVVYNELNDAWTEVENAAGMAIGIKIKPLKTLINKYADPNNNGLDGLRTFAAEKEANKATYKKDLQNLLTHIEKTLAANQQATDSSEPSDSSSGQPANDPVYDELEKAWTALVSAQGNMFALAKAEPALRKLMEKNAQDANTEPLKKFIKAHFNENKAFFNLLKGQLKTIVTEAKP